MVRDVLVEARDVRLNDDGVRRILLADRGEPVCAPRGVTIKEFIPVCFETVRVSALAAIGLEGFRDSDAKAVDVDARERVHLRNDSKA